MGVDIVVESPFFWRRGVLCAFLEHVRRGVSISGAPFSPTSLASGAEDESGDLMGVDIVVESPFFWRRGVFCAFLERVRRGVSISGAHFSPTSLASGAEDESGDLVDGAVIASTKPSSLASLPSTGLSTDNAAVAPFTS
jgi:hypothetical protein